MDESNDHYGAIIQSNREIIEREEVSGVEALRMFKKFIADFENFDPNKPEQPAILENIDHADISSSDELDELSDSYEADESDAEIDTLVQELMSEYRNAPESATGELVARLISSMDEDDSVINSASSSGRHLAPSNEMIPSSSAIVAPILAPRNMNYDFPLSFIVHKGKDGSITHIRTENYGQRYVYDIPLKTSEVLELERFRTIAELLKLERAMTTGMTRCTISLARLVIPKKIWWLRRVIGSAVNEYVHEETLTRMRRLLLNMGFKDVKTGDKWDHGVREVLKDFCTGVDMINLPDARFFINMQNTAVREDVERMVDLTDLNAFFLKTNPKIHAPSCLRIYGIKPFAKLAKKQIQARARNL